MISYVMLSSFADVPVTASADEPLCHVADDVAVTAIVLTCVQEYFSHLSALRITQLIKTGT